MPANKTRIAVLFGAILLGILGIAGLIRLVFFQSHYDDSAFDRKIWLTNSGSLDRRNPRGRMVRDVIDNRVKTGMSKEQVTDLLGKPDAAESASTYEYHIGNWGRCRLCSEVLAVHFDEFEKVTKAEIASIDSI